MITKLSSFYFALQLYLGRSSFGAKLFVVLLLAVWAFFPARTLGQDEIPDPCATFAGSPATSISFSGSPTVPKQVTDAFEAKWRDERRKLLVITATTSQLNPQNNFSIDDLNDTAISDAYKKQGYEPIGAFYVGDGAVSDKLLDFLGSVRVRSTESLTIHVIAHGKNEPDDFYLFFYNGKLPITSIIGKLKTNTRIQGKVFIILDSCFSGAALQSKYSTSHDLENIAVVASTSDSEKARFLKGKAETAFSLFLTRTLDEDWVFADTDEDGFLTYQEITNYLTVRLKCAGKIGDLTTDGLQADHTKFESDVVGRPQKEVIAFSAARALKITPFWQNFILDLLAQAKENQIMTGVLGNTRLIADPNYYVGLFTKTTGKPVQLETFQMDGREFAFLKADVESFNQADLEVRNNQKSLVEALSESKYGPAVAALISGDYLLSTKEFLNLEKSDEVLPESYYLAASIAQRANGDLDAAIKTYDRGLHKYPDSSRLSFGKASTVVFQKADANQKQSSLAFFDGIQKEIAQEGKLSLAARLLTDNYIKQLVFLGRTGEAKEINTRVSSLKEK
ncbi:MAG: hypothetical protein ACKVQJ_00455 [Pyrinomonadaceae bacterium]